MRNTTFSGSDNLIKPTGLCENVFNRYTLPPLYSCFKVVVFYGHNELIIQSFKHSRQAGPKKLRHEHCQELPVPLQVWLMIHISKSVRKAERNSASFYVMRPHLQSVELWLNRVYIHI